MTADDQNAPPPPEAIAAENAGAMLARGREDAGQSIEGIAAQLKLAPRQVRALEESDFAALPGRTFVRGFVRNYARLVHLDPAVVLAALPGDGADPGLTRPALATQGRPMGEIPAEHAPRRTWTRWAIPLALIAIVAVAVAYERLRPQTASTADTSAVPASGTTSHPRTPADAQPPPGATTLPNPVGATAVEIPPSGDTPGTRPADQAAAPPATAAASTSGAVLAPSAARPAASTPAVTAPATVAAASATAPVLELAFRGVSWIEVKDARGGTVLNMTGGPGGAQSVRASPPLDIVVGNAGLVDVTFRGARVDLVPYTRQNIARLTLR